MARSAQDYPISFEYGATSPPYSPAHPHKGRDWGAPMRTPLFPNDNRILTGNSGSYQGMTYDPHVHNQAGPDSYAQKDIHPGRHEFQPGQIVQVGWGDEWGNYVIVKNFTSGIYVVYAHLSVVNVMPGDIVGGYMDTAYKDIPKGYSLYKSDLTAIYGHVPAYFGYSTPTGWPKYQKWGRAAFLRQLAITNQKRLETCEAQQPDEYEPFEPPQLYTKKQE